MVVSKPKSEIVPCEGSVSDDGRTHALAFEFIPSTNEPRAIYVVFDGQRIATRGGNAAGEPAWVPLVEGYEVRDTPDLDGIVVYFGGARLH